MVEVKTKCPTLSRVAASMRFKFPFRSMRSRSNPRRKELAVVTTARPPQHAFRKDSISRKSPVTTSGPAPCNTDAFEVGRTKARTKARTAIPPDGATTQWHCPVCRSNQPPRSRRPPSKAPPAWCKTWKIPRALSCQNQVPAPQFSRPNLMKNPRPNHAESAT